MRTALTLAALAAVTLIGACNTIAGAGRDVSSAGSAVTSTAEDIKK